MGEVLAPFPKVYFAPIEETVRKWTWKSEYEYAASRPAGKKDVVFGEQRALSVRIC